MTDRTRPRHPARAAALSFLFPGLGQAYAGERWLAALFAIPILVLVAAAVAVIVLFADRLRNEVLSSSFLVALLLLDAVLMVWRLLAIAQVGFARRAAPRPTGADVALQTRRSPWRDGRAVVVLLLIATIAMHAYLGLVVGQLNTTLEQIFGGSRTGIGNARPPAGAALNKPDYHWNGRERVNFLLLGIDSGPGRSEALTDTILVISVDPVAKTAEMVSIPRDTGYLPLPDTRIYGDGLYPMKINQLSTDAAADPGRWCPDMVAGDCGLRTLERSVGLYLGITIQYYATIDLRGFAQLIDSLGGVQLCLSHNLIDPGYSGPTWAPRVGIELPAGCSRYDGAHALAFARIRKGYMEMPDGSRDYQNDFKRADRQQQLLLALRREFAAANLVFELPGLLDAIGRTITTDFPRDKVGDIATLLPLITGPEIRRVVLAYPQFVEAPVDPAANYLLIPKRDAVRAEMQRLFGANLTGWYLGSQAAAPPAVSPDASASP